MENEDHRNFSLPFTPEALSELEDLQEQLLSFEWNAEVNDCWSYAWNGILSYSSKKAYSVLLGSLPASPLFPWMWAGDNLGKHKFFFWLLLKDRLNTRETLRRKNMHLSSYTCAICTTNTEGTLMHLFFECPFSQACWNSIGINWNLALPPLDMIIDSRLTFGSPIFREIIITACWCIWTARNGVIFDN